MPKYIESLESKWRTGTWPHCRYRLLRRTTLYFIPKITTTC